MSSSFRRRNISKSTPSSLPTSSSSASNTGPGDSTTKTLLRGTKPWTGGVTLTSVGLRDLDSILGGGQPLGTCLLLELDRWTPDLGMSFARYWCAEAVSQKQDLMLVTSRTDKDKGGELPIQADSSWADEEPNTTIEETFQIGASDAQLKDLLKSLPRNLHQDEWKKKAQVESDHVSQMLEVLQEDDEENEPESEETAEEGLKIAWQYKKSIQQERMGHNATTAGTSRPATLASVFCHSYDLSGRMMDQQQGDEQESSPWWTQPDSHVSMVEGRCCECFHACRTPRKCGYRVYQKLANGIKKRMSSDGGSSRVIRILWHLAPVASTAVALPLLLSFARDRRLPVVVLVTIQPWTCPKKSDLISLRRTSDVVMQTRGFVSRVHYPPPPEFGHLHGLVLLPKVSTVTAATANGSGHFADLTNNKRPQSHVYGLKRDRRKLHISLLHIPPEDCAGGGGSVGGGGVRSGAGRPPPSENTSLKKKSTSIGCGGTGTSVLDF